MSDVTVNKCIVPLCARELSVAQAFVLVSFVGNVYTNSSG